MDGTAELLEIDRRYLVHPLHHPEEHKAPLLVTEGRGAMLHLADGREVIDGLAGWKLRSTSRPRDSEFTKSRLLSDVPTAAARNDDSWEARLPSVWGMAVRVLR